MSKNKTEKPRADVVLGELTKELPKARSAHPATCVNYYCIPI